MEFFTIGVYDSTEKEFFEKLTKNNIDALCDIRQVRWMRNQRYAFVNECRLRQELGKIRIKYYCIPELAPTTEIRDVQKRADRKKGELKTKRKELGEEFAAAYKTQIVNNFDFEAFLTRLSQLKASRVALFCVEGFPKACHRSIVADHLSNKYNYGIKHL